MRQAIGIDLGGTFLKYAVMDSDGRCALSGKIPSRAAESAEAVIGAILSAAAICRTYAAEHKIELAGIGIATPGIISANRRVVVGGAENIAGWENIPLADTIEQATHLPALIDNDANLMALAETRFGAAKGCTDVVFLTIGTGIGGGVLIGGRLYGGYRNRGTELGHITIEASGRRCACGSVGCLESYASTTALVARFAELSEAAGEHYKHIDGELVVEQLRRGNRSATQAMEEHQHWLGLGITSLIHIFSPQKIVIGGGISESGDDYIEGIRRKVAEYAMPACGSDTLIVKAELGNSAGCLGAGGLIMQK